MLEAALYGDNTFATLTYSDENLRFTEDGLPNLVKEDFQRWLKRFRSRIAPSKIRFFGVGEYGEQTQRPHYHVALFGWKGCARGRTDRQRMARRGSCCASCDTVFDTWSHGSIDQGDLVLASAQYIAGYTTKKMTRLDDERLAGRIPEFARMSLRPGIGAHFMPEVASVLLQYALEERDDVPAALRHGAKQLPLGRYLRRKLRENVGRAPEAPEATVRAVFEAVSHLWEDTQSDGYNPISRDTRFREAIIKENVQKVRNLEGREKLYGSKKGVL